MNILVLGRNAEILETVLRLLNSQPDWKGFGALTDEEAIQKFSEQKMDIVLVGGGVEESSEEKLSQSFQKLNPEVKIIRHYGGGSGLLYNEIYEAIKK